MPRGIVLFAVVVGIMAMILRNHSDFFTVIVGFIVLALIWNAGHRHELNKPK